MRRMLASAVLTGLALALPAWAFAQQAPTIPVIPPVKAVHARQGHASASAPDPKKLRRVDFRVVQPGLELAVNYWQSVVNAA